MNNENCINKNLLSQILASDENGMKEISKILSSSNVHMLIADEKNNLVFTTSNLIKLNTPPNITLGNMNFFTSNGRFYRLSMQQENYDGETFTIITYEDVSELVLYILKQKSINNSLEKSLSKLKEEISTDKRTSLLSQRGFFEAIGGFKYDLEKSNTPFVLVMLDLDNFKSFNDNFGHTEGDKFLSYIGNLLKRSFGENDAIGRYGGDEFIIAIENCTLSKASEILSRLQDSFYEGLSHFPNYDELKKYNFGISIGMAQYDNSVTYEVNKVRADKALYYGKLHGKHHIIPYSEKLEDLRNRELDGQIITAEDIEELKKQLGQNTDSLGSIADESSHEI